MKEYRLFQPDYMQRVDQLMPELIQMAKDGGEDVFLLWNDGAIRITADTTPDEIWAEHKRQDLQAAEANMMLGIRNLIAKWDNFNGRP